RTHHRNGRISSSTQHSGQTTRMRWLAPEGVGAASKGAAHEAGYYERGHRCAQERPLRRNADWQSNDTRDVAARERAECGPAFSAEARARGPGTLRIFYEAGPCGYALQRQVTGCWWKRRGTINIEIGRASCRDRE